MGEKIEGKLGAVITSTPDGTNELLDVNVRKTVGSGSGANTLGATKTVTVASTATAIAVGVATQNVTLKSFTGNTNEIFIGDSAVTTANGIELTPGEGITLTVDDQLNGIFAIVASGTEDLRVIWEV